MMTVFESRGNIAQHRLDQLNNEMISGLHWGPEDAPAYDRFYLTQGLYKVYRKFFNEKYCAPLAASTCLPSTDR